MQTNYIILSFVIIPLLGFLISLVVPAKKELQLARVAFYTTLLQLGTVISFIIYWLIDGRKHLNIEEVVLYQSKEFRFFIDFFFDEVAATYLFVGSFISFLIVRYSQQYMHLEKGYKRFFNTILFFYLGYSWTVLAGNFETLFIGWEILGISSFLLITFYRERYLPAKNAVKVFSIYRIGDVGILAAMWASHHLWHENITFLKLHNADFVHQQLLNHSGVGIFIGLALVTAAAAKSAQLPFSSWLPRAMEGPTPSSAIFYGSLSVHFGVFLLLRTFPFWEGQMIIRVVIGVTGLLTALVAHNITQVQSSIKPKIAYASITQIGIMFIEVALGWHTLVLFHFAGNAFLRTYQLLVSPSIVIYMIRDQLYNYAPAENVAQSKWRNTLYQLSLKEWYLDDFMTNIVFKTLKNGGKILRFIHLKNVLYYFTPLYGFGIFLYFNQEIIPALIKPYIPAAMAFTGLLMVLRSFAERLHPRLAWLLILFNHLSLALAVSFNENIDMQETIIFISGISVAGLLGFFCLNFIRRKEPDYSDLQQYYGHTAKYPLLAFFFLLATLGLAGFPITPSFIGADLLFSHIHENQYLLGLFIAASFIIGGIALIRIYARIFLGPYIRHNRSNPLHSS